MSGGPNPAEIYDQYFGPAMFTPLSAFVLERAALQPGERVLDLACGSGIVTLQIPPLVGETGKVVGVDIAPPMIAVASAKEKPAGCAIEFREGNGTALVDLDNGSFDVVICQQGLQFFPDRGTGASEMRRVLAPGGRAIVAVWKSLEHQGLFHPLIETEARQLDMPLEKAAMPFSFGDADALKTTFEDAGFSSVEIVEHEITAKFRDPDRFLMSVVAGAASVMPHFAQIDLASAIAAIGNQIAPVIAHYTKDDHIVTPMQTHVVIAKR
jgi:ubiquinone/menaquinone biosynthesis C-methylase UbiE